LGIFELLAGTHLSWQVYIECNLIDTDLIARARAGDTPAWETLILQNQEAVFRLAYLILGDHADADDIAQETFLRAYRALPGFDLTRAIRPWLLSIAANLARNRLRSVGRYLAALQRAWLADPHSQRPASVIESDDSARLWQAVRRLSPSDQEVIYLRFFSALSEAETAQALQVAAGTVKSRTHRALERLRVVIERDYPSLRESMLND
jgi:RNA polymerase sigma-70 factor (ECF subfamily)